MQSPLDLPLEQLLVSGGDTRLDLDSNTGLNGYGCGPRPSKSVPFGSCTGSSVSRRGFAAALETQRAMRDRPDPHAAAYECCRTIRQRLRKLLTVAGDIDVALAPSGTDVELLALALAAGGTQRRIVNIVVGPAEIGSGSSVAAAGCHYNTLSPCGKEVVIGEPIDPELAARVRVHTVDLRTESGAALEEAETNAAVFDLVTAAAEDDAIVLLHVVAHSKTGIHAPSLSCVRRLRKSYQDMVVVIDAAQGRFSRRGLREVQQEGYLVILTGSKFFGGPPFSGALLVPPEFHPGNRQLSRLPAGFGAYFSAPEMPETWPEIRQSLPSEPNFGAILRWSAAVEEIAAYYEVQDDVRLRILRMFESEVPSILDASKFIRLLPSFPPLYDDKQQRLLQSKTSVFGFWVTPPGAEKPLGKEELWELHAELNSDTSTIQSDASTIHNGPDRQILARTYHVGQPVHLRRGGYVLRIALGGELVSRVASDENLGKSLEQRLAWLRSQLVGLRQKIECLAKLRLEAGPAVLALGATGTDAFSGSPTTGATCQPILLPPGAVHDEMP